MLPQQQFLRLLALGDVGVGPHQARGLALLVPLHDQPLAVNPQVVARFLAEAELGLATAGLPLQEVLNDGHDPGQVIGMHP